jgi:hypothetical protein
VLFRSIRRPAMNAASDDHTTASELVASIGADRADGALSSAIFHFALQFLASEQTHLPGKTAEPATDVGLPRTEVADLESRRLAIAHNIERLRPLLACTSNDHEHKIITDLLATEEGKLAALPRAA